MGFFSKILSGVAKTVLTPVAIVKDAVDVVVTGEAPETTKKLLESAADDLEKSVEDLGDGEVL